MAAPTMVKVRARAVYANARRREEGLDGEAVSGGLSCQHAMPVQMPRRPGMSKIRMGGEMGATYRLQ